jgi:hypothetical protein
MPLEDLLSEIKSRILQGHDMDNDLLKKCQEYLNSQIEASPELIANRNRLQEENDGLGHQVQLAAKECDQIRSIIKAALSS